MKILIVIIACLLFSGCANTQLKDGELYINQQTSLGMNDFGVAKVRNQF